MATSPDEAGDDAAARVRLPVNARGRSWQVRGPPYRERLRVVRLADDVAEAFADEAAVNAALREYSAAAARTRRRPDQIACWMTETRGCESGA